MDRNRKYFVSHRCVCNGRHYSGHCVVAMPDDFRVTDVEELDELEAECKLIMVKQLACRPDELEYTIISCQLMEQPC